jgi:hypothetical protein
LREGVQLPSRIEVKDPYRDNLEIQDSDYASRKTADQCITEKVADSATESCIEPTE